MPKSKMDTNTLSDLMTAGSSAEPVLTASLREATFLGNNTTDSTLNQTKYPGCKLWVKGERLYFEHNNTLTLIPLSNVRACKMK